MALRVFSGIKISYSANAYPSIPYFAPTATIDPACNDYQCLHACMQQLPDMINETSVLNQLDYDAKQYIGSDIIRYKVSPDRLSLELLVAPVVPEYLKKYQDNRDLHQRIWRYYTEIFPEMQSLQITYVVFFTDGQRNTLAYIRELNHVWSLYIDLQDFNSQYDTTETLIHEYGHLLTMNDSQVTLPKLHYFKEWTRKDFDREAESCTDFFTGSECASPGSYIEEFGHRFWKADIYNEWIDAVFLPRALKKDKDVLTEFYEKHQDYFVSRYAAADPLEDLAETWTAFVLEPKPTSETLAGQKVLFFYEYDEMVQAREKIIQGICRYAAGLPR